MSRITFKWSTTHGDQIWKNELFFGNAATFREPIGNQCKSAEASNQSIEELRKIEEKNRGRRRFNRN